MLVLLMVTTGGLFLAFLMMLALTMGYELYQAVREWLFG